VNSEASESASAYIPLRMQVSMRTGTSNRSLSLLCCSSTTQAFVHSLRTSGPLVSLISFAAFSRAGSDSSMSVLSKVDSEDREDRREFVVVWRERKVGSMSEGCE